MKKLLALAAVVLLSALPSGCAQKRVLLVTDFPDSSPQVSAMMSGVRAAFREEAAVAQFNVFDMDTLRHPTEMWRQERGSMAVNRVRARRPDVILVAGDEAARYFATRLVNTGERLVFFGQKAEPGSYGLVGVSNVTGVREELPVAEAFLLMKKMVPSARGVAVLADKSAEGDGIVAKIAATTDLAIRVVDVRRAENVAEWMSALKDLQDKADVICIASYRSVKAGTGPRDYDTVPPEVLLKATAEANQRPDFTFWKQAVGPEGVLAAVYVPLDVEARMAAKMATRLLYYNTPMSEIPVSTCAASATEISSERAGKLGLKVPSLAPAPAAVAPAAKSAEGKNTEAPAK